MITVGTNDQTTIDNSLRKPATSPLLNITNTLTIESLIDHLLDILCLGEVTMTTPSNLPPEARLERGDVVWGSLSQIIRKSCSILLIYQLHLSIPPTAVTTRGGNSNANSNSRERRFALEHISEPGIQGLHYDLFREEDRTHSLTTEEEEPPWNASLSLS